MVERSNDHDIKGSSTHNSMSALPINVRTLAGEGVLQEGYLVLKRSAALATT